MSEAHVITDKAIQDYCDGLSSKPPPFLHTVTDNTRSSVGKTIMLSGQFLGQYLRMMSMVLKPKNVLEVGTFTGYGSICLLEGLVPEGKIVTIEKDPIHADIAEKHFSQMGLKNIDMQVGDAAAILDGSQEKWDLVFIDAAKRQYIKYYEKILPHVNIGGVILADNVLWKGNVVSQEMDKLGQGLHAFNVHVYNDDRVENMILPIDDGLHFIIKK